MADFRVLIALAAVFVVAAGYISFGVRSALAPLCAVGTVGLWFTLWGCLGLLQLGGWLFYGLAAALLAVLVVRHGVRRRPFPLPGVGLWFFVAACLAVLLLLWHSRPMFTTWDEYSLWGTADKLTKLYNELYTTAPVGWAWNATHPPALILQSYFFQFWGAGFAPWQTYLASDVFQFAAMAALLAPFERKNWNAALPLALIALLAPYVFVHYGGVLQPSPVYMDALADIPAGLWFAAALACVYQLKKGAKGLVPLCLALATLTLTKDLTGLLLALVVVGVLALDALFGGGTKRLRAKARGRRLATRALPALGAVLLPYLGWAGYLSFALNVDAASLGGKQDISMFGAPAAFFADLFSADKSEFFSAVTGGMARMFFPKTTLLGPGALVVLVIFLLLALAFLLAAGKTQRRRVVVFAVGSSVGFAAYYFAITLAFLYIFRDDIGGGLLGYERYIYPYYIAWFLAAAMLLGLSAAAGAPRRAPLAKGALLAVCLLCLGLVGRAVPPAYTLLGVHPDEFAEQRAFEHEVDGYIDALPADSLTFLVTVGDDGSSFFRYCYQLLPRQIDYSFGGNSLVEKTYIEAEGRYEEHELTADEWAAYLAEKGCTHLLIADADKRFRQLYGHLFADDMDAWFEAGTKLYSITPSGGAPIFQPLPAA